MMKCPTCGQVLTKPVKEWDLSPKVHVKMYEHCGKKVREYVKK
jgi:lysyl-tRNA synthetase class I